MMYHCSLIKEDQVQRYGNIYIILNICVKNKLIVFLKLLVFLSLLVNCYLEIKFHKNIRVNLKIELENLSSPTVFHQSS